MTIGKLEAWTIFRAEKLGHEEAAPALKALVGKDWGEYHLHAQEFEMELAQIGIEAQNEGAAIMEKRPDLKSLELIKPYNWTAVDYTALVGAFEGAKFEKLHLSAMFRVANGELLLDLVKP